MVHVTEGREGLNTKWLLETTDGFDTILLRVEDLGENRFREIVQMTGFVCTGFSSDRLFSNRVDSVCLGSVYLGSVCL